MQNLDNKSTEKFSFDSGEIEVTWGGAFLAAIVIVGTIVGLIWLWKFLVWLVTAHLMWVIAIPVITCAIKLTLSKK